MKKLMRNFRIALGVFALTSIVATMILVLAYLVAEVWTAFGVSPGHLMTGSVILFIVIFIMVCWEKR